MLDSVRSSVNYVSWCLETVKLESIILRFNKLTKVPSHLPSSLLNLDLVGNLIPEIQENTFAHLTKVRQTRTFVVCSDGVLTALMDIVPITLQFSYVRLISFS